MSDFPTFQWSFFTDTNRNSQIVVRTDTIEEMQEAITKTFPVIKKVRELNDLRVKKDNKNRVSCMCEVHKVKMYESISKKGNAYFSHRNNKGQICFGTGYKKEKR